MGAIEKVIARSGIGLEPPFRTSARPLVSNNPRTLGIWAHDVEDARGRRVEIIEKRVANRPVWSGASPEVLFYRRVLPYWPFMQAHACAFYGAQRGLRATTIFMAAASVSKDDASDPIAEAFALLPGMHQSGADLLASGRLGGTLTAQLDFYRPALARGRHGVRLARAAANPRCAEVALPRQAALLAALDRLAEASRAAPPAICHLDLLRNNIFQGPAGAVLIDWGEVGIAPAGFDYGSLMAAIVRSHKPKPARMKLTRMWTALRAGADRSPDGEVTLIAAYYYFLFGLVRYMAGLKRVTLTDGRRALLEELLDDACAKRADPGLA